MAINFLNNISLNYAELQKPRIWPLSTDPTSFPFGASGTVQEKQAYLGTTYFNTAIGGGLKIWTQTGSGTSDFSFQNVGISSITLTGDVTGTGTTSITTTIADGAVENAMIANATITAGKISAATLTVSTETFTSGTDDNIPTTLAVKKYIDLVATGLLEFKSGFNATNGLITGNTSNLTADDSPATGDVRVAIAIGDMYVVTVAGNFFGNASTPLTPGDSVICQTAAAAGASVIGDFVVVQSDTDLATISTVGIGNVNKANESMVVSYANGTASVKTNSNTFTVAGNGSQLIFPFHTGFGTNSGILATCQEQTTGAIVYPEMVFEDTTISSTTAPGLNVTFAVAPVNNKRYIVSAMRVV